MPIKLKKTDIENKVDNPKQGYKLLGFDNTGTLVTKDSDGTYKTVVPVQEYGDFETLNIISGLTIGYRLPGSPEGIYTLAQGANVIASGYASSAHGVLAWSINDYSVSNGTYLISSGKYSYAGGSGHNPAYKMESGGFNSFLHSYSSDVTTLGTYGDFSVIIGGRGHNIKIGADNSVILGGYKTTIDTPNTAVIVINDDVSTTVERAVYVPRIILESSTYSAPTEGTIEFSGGTYNHFRGYTGIEWRNLDNNSTTDVESISTAISSEISTRAVYDRSLSTSLSSEISSRSSKDISLSTAISSADTSLSSALSSEISVRTSADLSLSSAIVSNYTSLSSALSSEISVRTSADLSLSSAISTTDNVLSTSISIITSERIAAEPANVSALSSEISVRISVDISIASYYPIGDLSLSSALSSEISSRINGDLPLSSAISTEITDRFGADAILSTAISSEIAAREGTDTTLTGIISTEIEDRPIGDTSISDVIGPLTFDNQWTVTNGMTVTQSLDALDTVLGYPDSPNWYMDTGVCHAAAGWNGIETGAFSEVTRGILFVNGSCRRSSSGVGYRYTLWDDYFFAIDGTYEFTATRSDSADVRNITVQGGTVDIWDPGSTYTWCYSLSYPVSSIWQSWWRLHMINVDFVTGGTWSSVVVRNDQTFQIDAYIQNYDGVSHTEDYYWDVINTLPGSGGIYSGTIPVIIGGGGSTWDLGDAIGPINTGGYGSGFGEYQARVKMNNDSLNLELRTFVFSVDNGYDYDWLGYISSFVEWYDSGLNEMHVRVSNSSSWRTITVGGFGWFSYQHRDSDGIVVVETSSVYVGSLTAGNSTPHSVTFTISWTVEDTLYGSPDGGLHYYYMWTYE